VSKHHVMQEYRDDACKLISYLALECAWRKW